MKDLTFFTNKLNEGLRGPKPGAKKDKKDSKATPALDVDLDKVNDKVTNAGKKQAANKADSVKPGKSAEENGTQGVWAIDPPTPEDEAEWEQMDPDTQSNNANELANAFQSEENFIVLGEAGWAKTELITKMAKRAGRHVITVYLDKAVATDLGGIPVPTKDETTGAEYAKFLMPGWALRMLELTKMKKNIKFLLFFDELNQADPGVLNALMPIVLKHEICGVQFDNIVVGAAGNRADENDSVTDIESQKPLMSRFPSKIDWETHTEETWKDHFVWAHKKWDNEIGKTLIDKLEEMQDFWKSPRDLTLGIYEWVKQNRGKKLFLNSAGLLKRLQKSVVWDQAPSKAKDEEKLSKLCDFILQYTKNDCKDLSEEKKKSRKESKGEGQVKKLDRDAIKQALIDGYLDFDKNVYEEGDDQKYLVTVENAITNVFNPEVSGVNAEIFSKLLKEIEAEGYEPKYQKNDDGRKDAKKNGWHIIEFIDGEECIDGKPVQ